MRWLSGGNLQPKLPKVWQSEIRSLWSDSTIFCACPCPVHQTLREGVIPWVLSEETGR